MLIGQFRPRPRHLSMTNQLFQKSIVGIRVALLGMIYSLVAHHAAQRLNISLRPCHDQELSSFLFCFSAVTTGMRLLPLPTAFHVSYSQHSVDSFSHHLTVGSAAILCLYIAPSVDLMHLSCVPRLFCFLVPCLICSVSHLFRISLILPPICFISQIMSRLQATSRNQPCS